MSKSESSAENWGQAQDGLPVNSQFKQFVKLFGAMASEFVGTDA